MVVRVMIPCSNVVGYQSFGGLCYLHLHTEDHDMDFHCCENLKSQKKWCKYIILIHVLIGDHQCGFHHKRSTTDQIFYIRQILEKKWEYNGMVHQL
jgi:hypothetical protein